MGLYDIARRSFRNMPDGLRYKLLPLAYSVMGKRELKHEMYGSLYQSKCERKFYFYCVYQAAKLAKKLGHSRISVIEFGVAGGVGLIALERCADVISRAMGIGIEVYGFDTGIGLPAPEDYRDLPHIWKKGFYEMDVEKLRSKLSSAKLVIGDIKETAGTFFETYKPAPIGAVMFDMDFYTSTIDSMDLFKGDYGNYLPRIFTYFDDVLLDNAGLITEYTGERLAINEFNEAQDNRKFSPAYNLITLERIKRWYHQIYVLHMFQHGDYNKYIQEFENHQLKLL